MKTIIALLCAASISTASTKANAESIFVAKVPWVQTWPNGASFLEFKLDPELGHAWVSASFCERYIFGDPAASECKPYNQYNFRVRGLTYDGSSGVIRIGGHVCAVVENGLVRPIIRQTGHCNLTSVKVRQDYEFPRYWRWMDVISLQLK
ncbi:MAG TPA: hypothetical protein VHT93_15705, partial [Pseudolabrys sp.]|jgi:hypothetical protein|nr:hypothetical protein [Pseudolabrys sp.]